MVKKLYDILVIGELNPDLILSGDVEPQFGQVERLVSGARLVIGSSSAIFACGAARLGLRVAFIGKVGDDVFGRFMQQALADRGIDISGVVVDGGEQTGMSVILTKENDRAILTFPGAIPKLRLAEISTQLLESARHLHLGSYFIQNALQPDVPALFEAARRSGLSISLDTNYDPQEQWDGGLAEVMRRADIFLPNATECCAIAGTKEISQALNRLSRITKTVAVKLGADGAIARHGDQQATANALVLDVVDTVGAGDSFDAGFIYGYLAGWSLERSLRLGTICGSLSTRKTGGTAAQPDLEEATIYLRD